MARRLSRYAKRLLGLGIDALIFAGILVLWPLLGWWLSNVITIGDPTIDAKDVYYMMLKRWALFWACVAGLVTIMVLWG